MKIISKQGTYFYFNSQNVFLFCLTCDFYPFLLYWVILLINFNHEIYEIVGIATAQEDEGLVGGLSTFKNVGKSTKDGVLGTASAPIHMVNSEGGGHFKEQLWRTVRTIALGFLLISGVGALVEDKGLSKGTFVVS